MKLDNNENKIHILNNNDVWPIIKDIADNVHQEEAFYICNLDDIVEKHRIWQLQLPRVKPYYAVKCNDNIIVLKVLASLGISFDCASKAEISKILSIGVEIDRIIFANPAKPASHIRYAAATGISTMTFDNQSELYKIQSLFPDAKLVIRIRCDALDAQCPLGMKFGCDPIEEAPKLLEIAKSLNLNVIGVSFHVGSGCREAMVFNRAIAAARDVFNLAASLGFSFSLLDIGGGYPGIRGSALDEISNVINESLNEYFPDTSTTIIAEPGRFFVASAYTLTCNIHSVKEVVRDSKKHLMYYINDGVYGSFNCILYDHQVVKPEPLYSLNNTKSYSSSIWGPTCDGLDQVIEDELLPEMKMGDWIVFGDMGAYTIPVASAFNGFPVPKVYYAASERMWAVLKRTVSLREDMKVLDEKATPDDIFSFGHCTLQQLYEKIPTIGRVCCENSSVSGNHLINYISVSLD